MSISFRCQCGQKLRAREAMAGRQTRCPKCKTQVVVPQPPAEPAEVFPTIDTPTGSGSSGSSVSTPEVFPTAQPEPPAQPQAAAPSIDLVYPCSCGKTFRVTSEFMGKQIPCPGCGAICLIPSLAPQSQSAPQTMAQPIQPQLPQTAVHQAPTEFPQINVEPQSAVAQQPVIDHFDPTQNFVSQPIPAAPGMTASAGWAKVHIGLMILAISMIVLSAGYAFYFLGEGFLQLSFTMADINSKSMKRDFENRPSTPAWSSGGTRAERDAARQRYDEEMKKFRDSLEKRQKQQESRAKTVRNLQKTSFVFFKISFLIVLLASIATVVGYVFCIFAPQQKGIMGVAIAAISVSGLGVIFQLIFQVIPIMDNDPIGGFEFKGHLPILIAWIIKFDIDYVLISLFVDVLVYGHLILAAVLLFMIGKKTGHQMARFCGQAAIWLMAIFTGFILFLFLLGLIKVDSTSTTPLYLIWALKWLTNIAFGIGLFFLIKGFFASRKADTGKQKSSRYRTPAFR